MGLFRKSELPSASLPSDYDSSSEAMETILSLISRPVDPNRHEFLSLACKLVPGERNAALLWLLDGRRKSYVLDRIRPEVISPAPIELIHRQIPAVAEPSLRAELSPDEPASVSLTVDNQPNDKSSAKTPTNDISVEVSLRHQPKLGAWCIQQGFGKHEKLFALRVGKSSMPILGYVQILTTEPVSDNLAKQLSYLMDALAGVIIRGRSRRLLEVSARMRSVLINPWQQQHDWFQDTASVLKELTSAELCLVFKQQSDLSFKVAAGDPKSGEICQLVAGPQSLTRHIAQKQLTVRIADFSNSAERTAVFGTDSFDTKLVAQFTPFLAGNFRAWMAAPVLIGQHTIAVIMLLNKTKHLGQQFSETDQDILQAVCDDLGRAIPSADIYSAMLRISETRLSPDLSSRSTLDQIYNLLTAMIPGVAGAVLSLRSANILTQETELRELGGDELWLRGLNRLRASPLIPKKFVLLSETAVNEIGRYGVSLPLSGQGSRTTQEDSSLILGLHRNYLSEYEFHVLSFLCSEIGHLWRAEEIVKKQLYDTIQTHHAIASGLNGINHIKVLMDCYEYYRRTRDISELQGARFRKALERTYAATRKTQVLMQESRFLLGGITAATLRIGGHSLKTILSETVLAVKSDAERRGISIDVNIARELNEVQMDRGLLLILFYNLLDNAVKYSFRGRSIHITASIGREFWVVKIINHGVMIRKEDREDIFRPFERRPTGQAATTRPGTGLGLPVAQTIARSHGGSITVESSIVEEASEPVAETCFTVIIPRRILKDEKHVREQ